MRVSVLAFSWALTLTPFAYSEVTWTTDETQWNNSVVQSSVQMDDFEGYAPGNLGGTGTSPSDADLDLFTLSIETNGVLYNTFHSHLEEFNPARSLPSAGQHQMHVHLSESHRGELGRGQVQWQETFATLDFLDYRGWLIVQALGVATEGPAQPANIWRNNFDSEEQLSADAIAMIRQVLRTQRQ